MQRCAKLSRRFCYRMWSESIAQGHNKKALRSQQYTKMHCTENIFYESLNDAVSESFTLFMLRYELTAERQVFIGDRTQNRLGS
jgi:hypothetical protein